MRDFSDKEKSIIDKLIELDDNLSLNVLNNLLETTFGRFGEYYIKITSPEECSIEIERNHFTQIEQSGDAIGKIREILEGTSRDIFIIVKLLEYLEKNDLIYSSGDHPVTELGPIVVGASYMYSSPFDNAICELVYKYSRKRFVPTEALRRLKANDYLDDEEVRHRKLVTQYEETIKQNNRIIKYSAIAIFISLVAVAVSAFVPISTKATLQNLPQQFDVKINESIMQSIEKSLNELIKSNSTDRVLSLNSAQLKLLDTHLLDYINEAKKITNLLEEIKNTQQSAGGDAKNRAPQP